MVLELVWSKKGIKGKENHVFVGWTGMTSKKDQSGDNSVEIDPTFALNLGIQSKQKVSHSQSFKEVQSVVLRCFGLKRCYF